MYLIRNFIIFCTGLLLCMACATKDNQDESLLMAIQAVDNDPQEALELLEEIPYPEVLNQDSYMRYVTTLTQAKYMNDQCITNDTMILNAQRYFVENHNIEMAARASFYAANFYHEKRQEDKALEYFLIADYFAQQANNILFASKSTFWIGYLFYNQNMLDSALVYYKRSLDFYDNEKNATDYKLELIYSIGRICQKNKDYKNAFTYYNNGLCIAREFYKKDYEFLFLQSLGMTYSQTNDIENSKKYFNQALNVGPEPEDSVRLYLSYAILYREIGEQDSNKYYLDLVKNRATELSYPINRQIAYNELANYYEKTGNIKELKHYLTLANEEKQTIKDSKNEEKTLVILQEFKIFKEKSEQKYTQVFKFSLASAIFLSVISAFLYFDKRNSEKNYFKVRDQQLFRKVEFLRFLYSLMRAISKCVDSLCLNKNITSESIRKQFIPPRDEIMKRVAELVKEELGEYQNGSKASANLTDEEFCIINLTRLNSPDASIAWTIGYAYYSKNDMDERKQHIRCKMKEAGMSEHDIKKIFP